MATPKVQVLIDFDADGIYEFTEPNEDVSADVERLVIRGPGKTIRKHRAEAAILELKLRNDGHKYSPSNKSSVLYPGNLPGPNVWVLLHYPYDDFTAANGTTLASRKPPYDSNFAAWAGDTGDFDVSANKLIPKTTGNKSSTLDFSESDCYVGVNFTRGGTTSGLICRWSDASNYLLVYHDGTNLRLGKVDGGTLSSIASKTLTWATGTEKHIIVELHGDEVRVSLDQTLQIDTSTTFNNTATKHGVGGRGTHGNDKWDNFGGTRPRFFGRIDRIQPRPEINRQYCFINAYGDFERFGNHLVYRSAPTGGASNNADDILGRILDAIDFSAANRIMDTGTNLNKYANHEKALTRDGLSEIYQVQDDDVGFAYVDGQGYFRYEGASTGASDKTLDHRQRAPHVAIVKTWRANRAAGDETDMVVGQHFIWEDGKRNVENEVYFEFHRIARTSLTQVWRLETDDRPLIPDQRGQEFLAVGDESHLANPRPPKHTTDFTFNTAKAGTGTNLLTAEDSQQGTVSLSGSAAFTIDDTSQDFSDWNDGEKVIWITDHGGDFAYAFIGTDDPDGDDTKVTLYKNDARASGDEGYAYTSSGFSEADTPLLYDIFNVWVELIAGFDGNFQSVKIHNGSNSDGYITFLRLMADKGEQSSKTAARAENSLSQTEYGRRRVQHKTLHIDRFGDMDAAGGPDRTNDPGSAFDRAQKRIDLRSEPQEHLKPRMWNNTRANLMQIVHRSVSDHIGLIFTAMEIDDTYFIENQELIITNGGLLVECNWDLVQSIWGVWGHSRWGQFQWT